MTDTTSPAGSRIEFLEMTTQIVAAYVSNNALQAEDVPQLIRLVHSSLESVQVKEVSQEPLKPAVSVRKSIGEDYLICLEDGLKFKSLKRHLRTKYDMTPEEYREKWGLPADYPMVAPGYSKQRSMLAKQMGLGKSERE
ncbi:MucR family transcriptional regulator [Hyphomonas sp. UBA5107]|jgi:predicted transcriptional regulator|uniref:MucR family transcriptional regulator n=1 Tax=Hyphomonas sp. UBA5107 TaxID=1946636 RepID=UPI000C394C9C|nr:MucR family transcriptional regulator [Hyphomonas sp. UBA5107]MAN67427.1 transcriptional regulator [Hyphomonadaceae bacterium]MBA30163.1 transcriptional regulator [Hyphomonadaceae bacterium]|tara:strand:+ start:1859 stop:2275 length:417 start_codon:yes stop_codon:yes gene_type:complete